MRGNVRHHRKLYQRSDSGVWWAVYYDANQTRHRESTRCTDRAAAELWLKQAERQAQAPEGTRARVGSMSIEEACKFFLHNVKGIKEPTWQMYEKRARWLRAAMGHLDINGLTPQDVRDYISAREAKVSAHTVYKELVTLRRVLTTQAREGRFLGSMVAIIPEYSPEYVPRSVWLSSEQYARLAAKLTPERRRWTDACVNLGGARASEVSGLDWSDFDWANRRVHVRGTKTKKSNRWVPIPARFYDEYFPARLPKGQFAPSWGKIVRDLATACRNVEVPKVSPNDLRRTYGSWLIQQGVDIRRVAALMGTSVAMVETVYGQFSPDSLRVAVEALPQESLAVVKRPVATELEQSRFSLLEVD